MSAPEIKLRNAKGRIERTIEFMRTHKPDQPDATYDRYKIRLEALEVSYKEFNKYHEEVTLLQADSTELSEEDLNAHAALFIQMEEMVFQLKEDLRNALSTLSNKITASNAPPFDTASVNQTEVRLPPITIAPFSGDYNEWTAFHDMFLCTVHNNASLQKVQKLQYLKSLLKDEAIQLLRHIPITANNYEVAWEKLKSRYDKKNQIIHQLIKKFMDQPVIQHTNFQKLRQLTNTSDEIIRSLESLETDGRDPWIIFILLNKLDPETRQLWASKVIETNKSTLTDFFTFLENRCDAVETFSNSTDQKQNFSKPQVNLRVHHSKIQSTKSNKGSSKSATKSTIEQSSLTEVRRPQLSCQSSSFSNQPSTSSSSSRATIFHPNHSSGPGVCSLCNDGHHYLFQCKKFREWEVKSRREFVREHNYCFNCLFKNHSVKDCPCSFSCQVCKKRHHTLVHEDEAQITAAFMKACHTSQYVPKTMGLLPTAVMKCQDQFGNFQKVRALLDSGSQSSFVTEECIQRLGLKRSQARVSVNGFSGCEVGKTRGLSELKLCSRFDSTELIHLNAYILIELTSTIPQIQFDQNDWMFMGKADLADPEFYKPATVDIVIGAEMFFSLLRAGQIRGSKGGQIAQNTLFGYVITGEHSFKQSQNISSNHVNLDQSMRMFWETEEIPNQQNQSQEEMDCEKHFELTSSRNSEGRFVLRLPFKNTTFYVGDNLKQATGRMLAMERKFKINPQFKLRYAKFMEEYITLHHMTKVPDNQIKGTKAHYLPHHAVIKEDSTTTKLRVVFDASSKSEHGTTLNDHLMVGPTVQADLFTIVLRFRGHKYAFTTDITKMYRQILIDERDRDYLRVLWRSSEDQAFDHYHLNTVTYGTASAPYQATKSLNQLGKENETKYPEAAKIIQEAFYVDDLMTGGDTLESTKKLQQQVTEILSTAGFQLSKWAATHQELLRDVQEEHRVLDIKDVDQGSKAIKTLGLFWNSTNDFFSFQVIVTPVTKITKRKILSDASRLFDPLGWLAPSIIQIKIFFQQLWLLKVSWDDDLPPDIANQWIVMYGNLQLLEQIQVPRWLPIAKESVQLHGFCDASESAFSAVIYSRSIIGNDIRVGLVTGKTKVSPIKTLSIPRLELSGAVLLSRLMQKVDQAFCHLNIEHFFWTDSTIVLSWLARPPRTWQTFVANRTALVLEVSSPDQWNHVSSTDNPADCASRGIPPTELISHPLWWSGPTWLSQSQESWPKQKETFRQQKCPEEKMVALTTHLVTAELSIQSDMVIKYSSLTKLIRISSFCLRFISNCRRPEVDRRYGQLSTNELTSATEVFIKFAQASAFSAEVRAVSDGVPISTKSKLVSLHPFLDRNGLLRVGGRLSNAPIAYSAQHPIILPSTDDFTKLLVQSTHLQYLHAGATLLTSILFQRYWIIGHRNLIKSTVHKCVNCARHKATISSQLMGSLPTERITPSRPFSKVGIDYAGPVLTKVSDGRGRKCQKSYIAVFVCMAVKAIHLEVVSSLSTKAFIGALKRFCARRGRPTDIYSDNGTTFVGANRELQEWLQFLRQNEDGISHYLTDNGTNWHFIPPQAPNFGGLWEAGVKSVKFHLKRVLNNVTLTYEELSTVLATIESCLNSRPLCSISSDTQGFQPLTPSHFLIGEPMTTIAEPDTAGIEITSQDRWKFLQKLLKDFWKRWQREYVSTLQGRIKWNKNRDNLKTGELVLVKEDNLPPAKWSMARISCVHPGPDDIVRVVTLFDGHREFKRSIQKICKLPIN